MIFSNRLVVGLLLLGFAAPAAAQEASTPVVDTPEVTSPTKPATTPPAAADSSVADRVTFLLSGYEFFPTRADLDGVATADVVAAQLRAFVDDEDARSSLRLRALDALGYYDDEATVALLTRLSTEPAKADLPRRKLRTAGLLRHHAITALGQSKRAEAVPVLEAIVAEQDLQLTLTVIHALGKHGGKEGVAALSRIGAGSESAMVRREVQKWTK